MLLLRSALIQQMFSRLNEKLVRGQTRGAMAAESVVSNYGIRESSFSRTYVQRPATDYVLTHGTNVRALLSINQLSLA